MRIFLMKQIFVDLYGNKDVYIDNVWVENIYIYQ